VARKPIPKPHEQSSTIPKYVPKPHAFQPPSAAGALRVRFNAVDVGGPWCLSSIRPEHHVDLLNRLKSFESMTVAEVFAPGSEEGKRYSLADLLNPSALARLIDLELDDQTEIARLRISGERRLYGFLHSGGPDFYALWWDPEHQIWPSTLKNT
jgi:hypothetical protein